MRATPQAATSPRPAPTPGASTPPALDRQQYLTRLLKEGSRLYQAGWYGPATARFKEAARVSPGSAAVHLWYGRAAYRAGRTGEARRALERVMALAPGSEAAREARTLLDRLAARGD
jgi:Flp pilus assembly protein TadD